MTVNKQYKIMLIIDVRKSLANALVITKIS